MKWHWGKHSVTICQSPDVYWFIEAVVDMGRRTWIVVQVLGRCTSEFIIGMEARERWIIRLRTVPGGMGNIGKTSIAECMNQTWF